MQNFFPTAQECLHGITDAVRDNEATLMLDATCALQYIAFPQDIILLNEAREILKLIIDAIRHERNKPKLHAYRQNTRKEYLALAKRKRRPVKVIRKAIRKQFQYIR